MENQLAVLATDELDAVVTNAGIEKTDAEAIKQSYLPYFEQMAKIKEESAKINFENPTELDEKIARDFRLRTVKIRTGSASVKDERKRIHMLKANVEQSAYNLIKTTCELDEEIFLQVEKKREIAEKARKEALKVERIEKLAPFEVDTQFIDLLNMPDEAFELLLSNSELAYNNKIELINKELEAERERQRVAEEKRLEMIAENNRLRAEAEAKEKELEKERQEQARKLKEIQDKADAEKKKADEEAKKQREAAEKLAKEEKAKQDAAIEKERQERLKIEKELADKKAAELKAQQDAEAANETELSKGDAERFQDLIKDLEALTTKYSFKSKKFKTAYAGCVDLLNKTINYLISKQ